jgi:hypothetical protein
MPYRPAEDRQDADMADSPFLQRTAVARARGESERELQRSARRGALERIRRGAYVDAESWRPLSPEARHRLQVEAADAAAVGRPVFSHESAAVMWGIPIVGSWPARPQTIVPIGAGLRSNRAVVRREAALDPQEVVEREGFRLTDLTRTSIDIAASRSFLSGVCAIEHVLFEGRHGIDAGAIAEVIARRRPFRGVRRADAALGFSGAGSASPNESLCRVRFDESGFSQPIQQKQYRGVDGRVYPVDFYWEEVDVIGETDGRVKYEDPRFLNGRTPQQALWDEKQREDELRAQSSGFLRLTWHDAWNRAGLIAKLTRAGIPRVR